MKKKSIWLIGMLLLGGTLLYYSKNPLTAYIEIQGVRFPVEIAATKKEKERGLGYRNAVAPGHGMLFAFDHKEQYKFWMKGMNFPIDIVWIDESTVADITENIPVPIGSSAAIYVPRVPVNRVLEINAGEVKKFGIRLGDTVRYPN